MSSIIKISEAVSIALHGMAYISTKNGKFVNVKMLTKQISSSANHIAKILQRLVHAGLLKSERGPAGGYVLAKPSNEIKLLEVYEATIGPVKLEACPMGKENCTFKSCIFSGELEKANNQLIVYMRSKSLSEFEGIS